MMKGQRAIHYSYVSRYVRGRLLRRLTGAFARRKSLRRRLQKLSSKSMLSRLVWLSLKHRKRISLKWVSPTWSKKKPSHRVRMKSTSSSTTSSPRPSLPYAVHSRSSRSAPSHQTSSGASSRSVFHQVWVPGAPPAQPISTRQPQPTKNGPPRTSSRQSSRPHRATTTLKSHSPPGRRNVSPTTPSSRTATACAN
jgi:hypothetical protein